MDFNGIQVFRIKEIPYFNGLTSWERFISLFITPTMHSLTLNGRAMTGMAISLCCSNFNKKIPCLRNHSHYSIP